MAIPATPTNFEIQQGNQQILLTWNIAAGATSYAIQRSPDGVTYSALDTSAVNSFLDDTAVLGTMYYYKVASVNGDGTSAYSSARQMVAAPTSEMSLYELRLRAQQRSDRQNSSFVTNAEWNFFLNQSMTELYDMLITVYEDYFVAPEVSFPTNGTDLYYPLPNGTLEFTEVSSGSEIVAEPFYKLLGLDFALNSASNAYVTLNNYNLIDRNRFVYPNTSSTIYGVFNLQYRIMGNQIRFIPTPQANQTIKILYAPRLAQLLRDTDLSTIGFSGWLQYVIVRAAKYALDKEESDTTKLDEELLFLQKRIEGAAPNKDAGQPNRISDTRGGNGWGYGGGPGGAGFQGGW